MAHPRCGQAANPTQATAWRPEPRRTRVIVSAIPRVAEKSAAQSLRATAIDFAALTHLRAASDARSPRCEAEALDQKIDEDPHLGSLMTARRQQSKQWVGFRILRVLQQGLQQSLADGARDHVLAQSQDARSSDCQLQQYIRAIGADGTFDVDPGQLALDSKRPARRARISAQSQACVTNQIGRFGRPAMTGEVTWTCANHPREIDDLAGDKPGVLERPHAQGDVDVF